MMNILLTEVQPEDIPLYKKTMQAAFQQGFEEVFGPTDQMILPESDIDASLKADGAIAYKAVVDGDIAGGAVVVIDERNKRHELALLFVKPEAKGKGIGTTMWFEIERRHSDAVSWETCTPYFDQRNIHFYVNVCGFHIVEFFHEHHPMDNMTEDFAGDGGQGMFAFRKQMR